MRETSSVDKLHIKPSPLRLLVCTYSCYGHGSPLKLFALVGQWAPIVGTGLAVLGSLYRLFAASIEGDDEVVNSNHSEHHGPSKEVGLGIIPDSPLPTTPGDTEMANQSHSCSSRTSHEIEHLGDVQNTSDRLPRPSSDLGNRRKVADVLTAIGNYVGTAAEFRLDDYEFKHGKAVDFPEIPGEDQRNPKLPHIREAYNQTRGVDGNITPVLRPSRPPSINGSTISGLDIDRNTGTAELASPSFSSSPIGDRQRLRRDTLEVPPQVHHNLTRFDTSRSENQTSPVIVVSSETIDMLSLLQTPRPKPSTPP